MTITLRAATPADAADMAALANIAGEGLPSTIWAAQASGGEGPLDVGRMRAARSDGLFSWTNAIIAELDGQTAGAVVSYLIPEDAKGFDESTHPMVRPLVALEEQASRTRFVSVLATYEDFRGHGAARAMIEKVEAMPGPEGMSIITSDNNISARTFYGARGYVPKCTKPAIHADWTTKVNEWVLMAKS